MKEQIEVQEQNTFSKRARKLLGRAFSAGVDRSEINSAVDLAAAHGRLQGKGQITRGDLGSLETLVARKRLRDHDWKVRIPEKSELFEGGEVQTYIDGCDYPESADDLLLALEVQRMFGQDSIGRMRILDAMCGPGRLGREFLGLGVQSVWFHDGDEIMTAHAKEEAHTVVTDEQNIGIITALVEDIPVSDNSFDLVICHNATHQMANIDRLGMAMREFIRITTPGGHVIIADYQRHTTPEFLESLEERLKATKRKIVPLLLPSFFAAFSKEEFDDVLSKIPGIRSWSVTDAQPPVLDQVMQERVEHDFVKGHLMNFSPISLRAIIQKE